MIDLLIDASLLACPNEELDKKKYSDDFLVFVTALTELSRFRRSLSSSRVWREASLAATLYAINAYPFKHAISKAMQRIDPSLGFQAEDISKLASALLSKSSCLNDFSDLEDVVVENCHISNDPIPTRKPELAEYACKATEFAFCHLGNSKALPGSMRLTSSVSIPARLQSIVQYSLAMTSYKDGSINCSKAVRVIEISCFAGNELTLRDLDPVEIWMKADEPSLLDAISIYAANQGDIDHCALADFREKIRIGSSLVASCQALGFLHEPSKIRRLISACADICSSRNLDQSHWLRKGKGPNEPQRVRSGGGFAWRHDVDHDFHLHYWRVGEVVELANVVVHNDFSISD